MTEQQKVAKITALLWFDSLLRFATSWKYS